MVRTLVLQDINSKFYFRIKFLMNNHNRKIQPVPATIDLRMSLKRFYFVLWDINNRWLFNAKFYFYIYIKCMIFKHILQL